MVIDGQGFTWATKVSVGGVSAPFTIVSNNQLRVTVAARTTPGAVNVQIITPAGASTATASSTFTYTAPPRPVVSGLSVTSGPATARTTVLINGSGLAAASRVTVGGVAVPFAKVSSSQISTILPSHAAGTTNVQVTTPGGTSATSERTLFTWV